LDISINMDSVALDDPLPQNWWKIWENEYLQMAAIRDPSIATSSLPIMLLKIDNSEFCSSSIFDLSTGTTEIGLKSILRDKYWKNSKFKIVLLIII
jgi:hypothetical protein